MNTNNPTGPTAGDGGGWFDDFAPLTHHADPKQASGTAVGDTTDDVGTPDPASGEALEETDTLSAVSSSAPTPPPAAGPGEADTDTFAALAPDATGWEWIGAERPASSDADWQTGPTDQSRAAHPEEHSGTDVFPLSVGGPRPLPSRRRRSLRGYVIAAALLAVVAVVAGVGAFVVFSGGSSSDAPVAAQTTPEAPATQAVTAPADPDCPNRTDGPVTTGRDPGGTTSGPAAIKAFEYAYFVDRSGEKARQVVAPLARVPSAQEIQGGLDTGVAPGTGYCLTITDRTGGLWGVELTVLPPAGAEPQVLRQLISTAVVDGRTLITAITKDTTQ
ncbi:hypothetical protein [Williamsia soli]|uniref:hypothetical protein n=1 Tax=Williamsia soli TaxID=364929 RepID=UPI001A9D4B1A|nr:hypothetical protein [Williamsia soli]